jgi:anhydro-N-acetylmuramic acid kinase
MRYIGLMSGTSVDSIDAVLVTLEGASRFSLDASHQHPIPPSVKDEIHRLSVPGACDLDRLGELDTELGLLFAQAVQTLLDKAAVSPAEVTAIGSHGQTLRHRPRATRPFTLQIGNPAVVAEQTGITTAAYFRQRDLAAGGEGAPLVPGFHRWLFQAPEQDRVVLNIGGIANLTFLPADPSKAVTGFDTGPGNTLLDRWIEKMKSVSFDKDGAWAASGRLNETLLQRLLADPYFSAPPPKSTGREYFNLAWLPPALVQPLSPPDVENTLVELTACSIARAIQAHASTCKEVFVCGGGAFNDFLMSRLRNRLGNIPLDTTQKLGLAPEWVEACAFAWLAHRCVHGQPGNVPSATGARHEAILGAVFKA